MTSSTPVASTKPARPSRTSSGVPTSETRVMSDTAWRSAGDHEAISPAMSPCGSVTPVRRPVTMPWKRASTLVKSRSASAVVSATMTLTPAMLRGASRPPGSVDGVKRER